MTVLERPPPPAPVALVDPWGRALPRHAQVVFRQPVSPPPMQGAAAWRWVVLALGAVASAMCTVLVQISGRAGYFGDEPSHLLLAHRFYDSLTPGFGQFGNYWPPLVHVAEIPFAWNDWLVSTGLAGAIPSMVMFLVAVLGAYTLGTELTRDRRAGAVAAAVLIANPNMLYLQSSAMMESGIVMTLLWVTVWLLRFWNSGRFRDLAWAGAWSALAVFATWAALILPVYGGLIVARACRRKYFDWPKTRAYVVAYSLFSGYAVALWLGWNWYIQNDPLYMLHYRHPATTATAAAHTAASALHPDAARGLLSYAAASWDIYGPLVCIAAGLVLLVALLRGRVLHPVGVTLIAGALVLVEMARGQGGLIGSPSFAALEGLSGPEATGMNIRYVLWVAPFAVVAVACLAGRRPWRQALAVAAVIASSVWFLPSAQGVVTLHSGDMMSNAGERQAVAAASALDRDYDSGLVLTAASGGGDRLIWLSSLPAKKFVTEFNPDLYGRALRAPASVARFVLSTPTLRETLPSWRLMAAGFTRAWRMNVAGQPVALWLRPAFMGGP
jgi:hypothetical protein